MPVLLGRSIVMSAVAALIFQGPLAASDEAPLKLDDGWEVAAPSAAGFLPAALDDLTQSIENQVLNNVHAVIVEHDGRLVYERYFEGHDERWGVGRGNIHFDSDSLHDLRSVTKSVTTALLGIALGDQYRESLERPITAFFPDLEGKFGTGLEAVNLFHVLTMTAGLDWNEMTVPYTNPKNDEIQMYYTDDPMGMVLARDVRDAVGKNWYYNGGLTQVVAGLIQRKSGQRLNLFAEEKLFGPLGISEYEWLGSRGWPAEESPSAASGLRLRARDLAKIGSLYLHRGVWNGRQIIPVDWIDLSMERHVQNVPWGPPGVYGYGFMWYPGRVQGPTGYRVIRASGNGDQKIFVMPDEKIVITVFAGNYNDYSFQSGEKVRVRVMSARHQ